MYKNKLLFLIFALLLTIFAPFLQAAERTGIKYNWKQHYYGEISGKSSLLFSRQMEDSKLAFADIDDDGDQDLFMGQKNGELAYFENKGTAQQPEFILDTQQYKAIFEQRRRGKKVKIWNRIDVGGRSAPSLIDIDFDGDFDLFIGSADGRIWHFENIGNNLIPVFQLITTKFENISIGKNLTLIFADINLQRKYDLMVGTVDGKVWLYYNNGTRRKPDFHSKKPLKVVEFKLETHAVPSLVDWDDDNDLDLIVGKKNGSLSFFENKGDRFFPDWKLKDKNFQLIDIGGESAPVFLDFDQDNDQDLVIGSANPMVSLYINRTQKDRHILWNSSNNIFAFNKLVVTGQRGSIATGDLDADGDLDLIVGEQTGNLNHFKNTSNTKSPNWELQTEELLFMTGMQNSAPALGDLDGDGDLDLLVGDQQGQIAFIQNIGSNKKAKWALKDKTYFNIDVGSNSVPRLLDYDKDGDLDLFIGNFTGRVIYYQNKGSKDDPIFAMESTRFASAKATKNAVPAFFDWNNDQRPDLILGDEDGTLQLYIAPVGTGNDNLNWIQDTKALSTFNVDLLSHPIFDDFNGDQEPDLLIGNYEGDFVLHLNMGTEGEADTQQIIVDNSIDQQGGSLVVENVEGPLEIDIEDPTDAVEEEEGEASFRPVEEVFTDQVVGDPKWAQVVITLVKNKDIRHSVPTFGDLDQDGDLDLLIGSSSGKVFYYDNKGDDQNWDFKLENDDFLKTAKLQNTAPLLVDLDQDGDLDLLLGTKSGRLFYYNNQGSIESPNFILEKEQFKGIWLGKNSRPSVLDLNNDSILDVLVGNLWGKLTFIRNDSNRFSIIRRDYKMLDVGIGSSPTFADLNHDGQLELILGSDAGKFFFFNNSRKDFTGTWTKLENYGGPLSIQPGSAPVIADIDHDGDKDLITGSDVGLILMYQNKAIVKEEAPIQEEQ